MQRRDFLKYFGIGASVVPLIGGIPKTDTVAKLIEEPKADVKLASQMPTVDALDFIRSSGPKRMQVSFASEYDGPSFTFECRTFIVHHKVDVIPVTRYPYRDGAFQEFIPAVQQLTWELELEGLALAEPAPQFTYTR
jgi:hypothetical protein